MDNLPLVSDEELSTWEQSTGEYLNRYAAKRLMFTVRDLRARITTLSKERDVYAEIVRNVAVDGLGLTDPWDVSSPTKAPDWTGLLSQRVADLRAKLTVAQRERQNIEEQAQSAYAIFKREMTASEADVRLLREYLQECQDLLKSLHSSSDNNFCWRSGAIDAALKERDMEPQS